MQLNRSKLISSATKIGISQEKAEELWQLLDDKQTASKFDLSHVLYYFGAMIVILALGWFVGIAWKTFGSGGILTIALIYIVFFILVGSYLWHQKDLKVPGGLFITIAVCLIPLAVYGFQQLTGFWIAGQPGQYQDFYSWIRGGWMLMEVSTIIGALVALYFFRFPFLTAPLFFTLWFMSMDITPLLFKDSPNLFDKGLKVSIVFGLILILIAYLIDRRTREDFALWGYFFGVLTFWSGISLLESASEMKNFFYFLINLTMVLLSVFLERKIFLIFGAIGIFSYLSSLFYRHFYNSIFFPFILSFIGILIVFVGILYRKNKGQVDSFLFTLFPKSLRKFLPRSRVE